MKRLLTAMAVAAAVASALAPTAAAQPTAPPAPPTARPCEWVTAAEATDIFGKPVTLGPSSGPVSSPDTGCFYIAAADGSGVGISSELLLPGPPAAASMLADAAAKPGAATVNGLGVDAVCVFEPRVTPPSTTVLVLLDGGRIYRVTAAYEYCTTVERFARTAVDRITS